MLSKPILRSPSGASSYYYQTENKTNSLWGGKAAEDLGLKGQVKIEQFNALLNGFHPYKDEKLRQNAGKENAIAGWDFTFSLSKNASILAFNDKRIESAFKESVDEALKVAEERYASTRTGQAGINSEHTQNLVYAKFTHYNSRANDPQMHTHVFIFNTTKGEDGKYRSLDNREFYSNYKHIGQIQEHILSQKLRDLGYKLDTNHQTGIVDIKTERDDIKEFFSKRSSQIKEEFEKNKDKYRYDRDAKQQASWDTRQEKDHNFSYREMKEKVQKELIDNFQMDLSHLNQEAVSISNKNINLSKAELNDLIQSSINDITKTQSAFTYEQLENAVLKQTLNKNTTVQEVEKTIKQAMESKELMLIGTNRSSRFSVNKTYYTTPEMILIEKETISRIEENPRTGAIFDKDKAENFIEEKEIVNNFKYTDGQKEFIEKALTQDNKYLIVQGNAGSGKTAAIDVINKAYVSEGYRVIALAPTGKAKNLLKDAGVQEIYTVAKFKQELEQGKISIDQNTAIITDEASMVSSKDMHFIVSQSADKIILIGDVKQFKPIEQGKIFEDMQKYANKENLVNMVQSIRFKTDAQKNVSDLMNQGKFEKALEQLEKSGDMHQIENTQERLNSIKKEYLKHYESGKNIILITNTNKEKDTLNSSIRKELQKISLISDKEQSFEVYTPKNIEQTQKNFAESYNIGDKIIVHSRFIKGEAYVKDVNQDKNSLILEHKGNTIQVNPAKLKDGAVYSSQEKQFAVGDKVIFLKNDKKLEIANGETGKILDIENNRITVQKDSGDILTINTDKSAKENYNYLDHAYAVTNYKSQGQTSDITIYSHNSETITNQESFYVASTRAKEETIVYTDDKETLNEQIKIEQEKISTMDFESPKQEETQDKTEEIKEESGKDIEITLGM